MARRLSKKLMLGSDCRKEKTGGPSVGAESALVKIPIRPLFWSVLIVAVVAFPT